MSKEESLTRSQAVEQVLSQLDGPIEVNEFCESVLALYPSQAKDPVRSIRSHLRQDHAGQTLVFLDAQTILPLQVAMRGVRFRIPLSRSEVKRKALIIKPFFDFFLRQDLDHQAVELLDEHGRPLAFRLGIIPMQSDMPLGSPTVQQPTFRLGGWFRAQGIERDDHILVTVENWLAGRFRLQHEASRRRRKADIEQQDRELADLLFGMLEASHHEYVYAFKAILTAYARLTDPRGYPGNHWTEVVRHDERMRYDGWAIRYSDWRSPLETVLYGDETPPDVSFAHELGDQVYRFKAALSRRSGLWRRIEIQGEQTLAELDFVLRDAFEHDSFDHLSGFWKRVRRGTGNRFREVDVGEVNPFGQGSGADVPIASLGLAAGDELKYVYDFGDWIEHRLTLESIGAPEVKIEYPRITKQNRPQYKDCQSCQEQGRKSRATWICLTCSNKQGREILVCRDCLGKDHGDHYIEEILY